METLKEAEALIYDRNNMMEQLSKYVPEDETIRSAMYCKIHEVDSKKLGFMKLGYDVFVGITEKAFHFVSILIPDLYLVFPFDEIAGNKRKKAMIKRHICTLSLKDGSTIKFEVSELTERRMPGHIENMKKLLECLEKYE